MRKRGRTVYVPSVIIEELEDVKREKGLMSDCEAFREVASYSQVGREAERLMTFRFTGKPLKRKGRGLF